MESLERRLLLAADLDPGFGESESVFWIDRSVEIRRGQWVVQFDSQANLTDLGGVNNATRASALAWLERKPAKEVIATDAGIERRLYEFDDVLVRSAMLNAFSELADVLSVEPNYQVSIDAVPNDPSFGQLWGLNQSNDADIDAPEAWELTTGSSNLVVGVIDTGVDYNHEDLAENIWVNPVECPAGRGTCVEDGIDDDGNGYVDDFYGWDFYNNDNDPFDDNSHGTHVAGTIAALGNNGKGVVGVNWNAKIMALKFLGSGGSGALSDAVKAIEYATKMRRDHGINIRLTNNSWGGGGFSQSMSDAIAANRSAGMLFVAAAGNDSTNNDNSPAYPASYNFDNVLSVAATTSSDALASFSNYGRTSVHLGAPGASIYSTTPNNGYGTKSGTSMASPHVAGVAALAWANSQSASYVDVRAAILGGVDPIPLLNGKTITGGRLNALATLQRMGLFATIVSPLPNSIVDSAPLSFEVDFSSPINPGSVNANDFNVNGIPASGFTLVDADSIQFTYTISPVTTEGAQTIQIVANSITRALDGDGVSGLSIGFFYDPTPLRVDSTTPGNAGILSLPNPTIQFSFSEALSPGSIGVNDLVLSDGRVDGFSLIDSHTVVYQLTGINSESVLTIDLASGAVVDTDGFPNQPFSTALTLDITTGEYPGVWNTPAPLGSRIRQSSASGLWHDQADEDRYLVDLESGQMFSIGLQVAAPSGGSAPAARVRVLDPSGIEVLSEQASAGQAILVNALVTESAGQHTIVVDTVSGTGGSYDLQLTLSSLLESEPIIALDNDSQSQAQAIDAGWSLVAEDVDQLGVIGSFAVGGDSDWYALTLQAGEPVTIAVASTGLTQSGSGPLGLGLHSATGVELAAAVVVDDEARIVNFAAATGGLYFINVTGRDLDYALSVTAGGTLDADRIDADQNGSIADAQLLQLPPRVVGRLGDEFQFIPGVGVAAIDKTSISLDSSPEGDMIRDLVFTPDGTRYLIAHRDSENVLVYDSATGIVLAEISVDGKPVDLEVSPNGAYALTANSDGNSVTVIDLATLSKVAEIETSSPWPYRVHVTADQTKAIVATAGGEYIELSLSTFSETRRIVAAGLGSLSKSSSFGYQARTMFQYSDFVLTPDGTKLVGPGTDVAGATVDIFSLATGIRLASIPVPDESPTILISPDGSLIYAVSRRSVFDSTISKISLTSHSLIQEVNGPGLSTRHVLLAPNEQELIGGRYGSLQFIDLTTGNTTSVAAGDTASFAISHDNRYVLARDLVDLTSKTRIKSLPFYSSMDMVVTSPTELRAIQAARVASDQYKWLDINGATAAVLETRTGGSTVEGDTPVAMLVTADGTTAVTANYGSKNLSVVDLSSAAVARWIEIGFNVESLAITPDGRRAITGGAGASNSVAIVDLVEGVVDATLTGINFFPRSVAISADGNAAYALTTGLTDTPDLLYFIDVAGAASVVTGTLPIGNAVSGNEEYSRMQLSPDGSLLAIPVTGNGELVLIDTASRVEVARIDTGGQSPTEIMFTPDGTKLFVRHSTSNAISVIRVDGPASQLQRVITSIPSPAAMTIDDTGDYLYVATSLYRQNNEVHVVDANSYDVVQTVSLQTEDRPTRMHQHGRVIYVVASQEFTPQVFDTDPHDALLRVFANGIDSQLVDATSLSGRSRLISYSPVLQAAIAASQDQDLIDVVDFSDTSFGDEDYYQFLPQVGDVLTIQTTLPGSAVGLIDNDLDLAIEVYDPQGRRIASSETGHLQVTATAIGAHSIRVFAQNFTRGEYLLTVDGASVTPGPSLLQLSPVDGQRDVAPDASLQLVFDEVVLAGSGQILIKRVADDSLFSSIAAASAEVSLDGAVVTITPATAWELGTAYYVLIDAAAFTGMSGQPFSGISTEMLWDFSVGFGFDFGDAPAPYPVAQSESGARHSLFGPQLGALRDSEPDGVRSSAADADDLATLDDEDGVVFSALAVGQIDASIQVHVRNIDNVAYLDAWIDFNADGHFGGRAEQIATSVTVVEGDNTIYFDVPAMIAAGQTYARVRLSTTGNLGVSGNAIDGEIEDYRIEIAPPHVASSHFYPIKKLSPQFSGGKNVVPVDLDGDGDIDLLHPDGSDNNVAWLKNDGHGNFVEQLLFAQWNTKFLDAADIDRDGDMDVLYLLPTVDEVGWFRNQGGTTFTKVVIDNQLSNPQDISLVDFDQDGDQDIVLVDNGDDIAWLYRNNGDQSFTKEMLFSSADASLLEIADLDRDGDLDIVVNDDGLSWYEQTAIGWTQHAVASGTHYAVEVFDVDSDGRLDIVSADSFKVNWYRNTGTGSFTTRLLLNLTAVRAIEFADLDGDGDMDAIAKGSNAATNLSWLENDGAQNFLLRTLTDQTNQPVDLATADLDGDADLDVILTTDFDGVGWIENTNGILLNVEELTPSGGSAMIPLQPLLAIRFDQLIKLGTGKVTLYSGMDDSIVEVIDVTSANAWIDADTLVIDPVVELTHNTAYEVRLDAGVVSNVPGDPFNAVTAGQWTFRTVGNGADYGDAPDALAGTAAGNYNTRSADNGPSHVISADLFLGRLADADDGSLHNHWANSDDGDSLPDDEDSLIAPQQDLVLTAGAIPTVAVVVTNLTTADAKLVGWIDYDGDGVFAASELAEQTVAAGASRETVTLSFPAVPASSVPATYMRLRLGNDTVTETPVGSAGIGEVEDHAVVIRHPSSGTVTGVSVLSSGLSGVPTLDATDRFGASLAALGDLDGDGVEDLAIGAPGDDDLATDAGAIYIAMMNQDGTIKSYQKIIPNTAGLPFNSSDQFGSWIAAAGDLDADGVQDLYAVSKATGNTQTASLSRVLLNADGSVKSHSYHLVPVPGSLPQVTAFASIGDLDADGNPDFVFGESNARIGTVYSGALHIMFSNDDGSPREFALVAGQFGGPSLVNFDYFGASVSALGDVNGDGVIDLAVGAYGDKSVTTNSGAVYVLFMKRDGSIHSYHEINGTHPNEPILTSLAQFGYSVAAIGDLDGNGTTDLLVGADNMTTGSLNQAGQVYVLYLDNDGTVLRHVALGVDGPGAVGLTAANFFGKSVAPAGDINGDGVVDLVVGSLPGASSNRGTVHTLLLDASSAPAVVSVQVNQGSDSRSQVTSLSVTFDRLVDHQSLSTAFTLTNTLTNINVGQLMVTADDRNEKTTAQLVFSGASTVQRAGTGALANSLADGTYRLQMDADQIRTPTGTAMINDYLFDDDRVDAVFRLFGDFDGDRDVDGRDYGVIGPSFLSSSGDGAFNPDADFDGDGDVDGFDLGRFRQSMLSRLK